jgi:acyl-CoA reductase-like NAD-dependent aldehyde dehydrogenase
MTFKSTSDLLNRLDGLEPKQSFHYSPRQTDEILFEFHNTPADEIAAAAEAAQNAWPSWRRKSLAERQQILDTIAQRLISASDDLARQIALEIGKPIRHAREEIHRAAANIQDVIKRATISSAPRREPAGWLRHEPVGVVGIISAWNNPVAIPLGKIAPALVYGNTVVWKPAPAAARISQALTQLFYGLPADTVRLVTGNATTAQAIAANENIDALTLTGSLSAGRAIQEIWARRIVPLQMELSGNNAAIVWRDADFAAAAEQVASGAFAFAGQRCTANRRVIVHSGDFEKLLTALESATARLRWGDPLEPETEIGPVLNSAKRDELDSLITLAKSDGAAHRVVLPQSARAAESWVRSGAYAQPVIACCDQPEHQLVQEETMSPLLIVQRADDFDHALALCNGVRHGLIAALFTNSAELQKMFLGEARAGVLKLNSSTAGVDITLPFGGWKSSGFGPPEHGDGDIQFYTRMQAVYGVDKI